MSQLQTARDIIVMLLIDKNLSNDKGFNEDESFKNLKIDNGKSLSNDKAIKP
jgi:hypothetical protein